MNAGMHGMADGRGMTGRKIATQLRSETATDNTGNYVASVAVAFSNVGVSFLTLASVTGAVDTLVFNLNGRGAVRWVGIGDVAASNTILARLVVDGKTIVSGGKTSKASTGGLILCGVGSGGSTTGASLLDYIPFDSSVQIYYKTSTTTSPYLGYVIDLHE